jgi:hypothetical protein
MFHQWTKATPLAHKDDEIKDDSTEVYKSSLYGEHVKRKCCTIHGWHSKLLL